MQVANDADIVRTTEVLVTNLPRAENPVMITSRLSRLSDNCGGKVGKLMPTADGKMQCVISFSDATRADRYFIWSMLLSITRMTSFQMQICIKLSIWVFAHECGLMDY